MRKRKRDGRTASFAADKEFDLLEAPHFLIILLCQWPVYHCLEETCTVALRIIHDHISCDFLDNNSVNSGALTCRFFISDWEQCWLYFRVSISCSVSFACLLA